MINSNENRCFFDVYRQPVGLQSVAGNCYGELRAEECTVLVLEVAVFSSIIMPPAGTTAFFSLSKIRGHNQHCSPTGTRLSGSGQGFPTETLLCGDCCTYTQLIVGLPAVVAVCVPTASLQIRSGATASYLYIGFVLALICLG